jgi:hypothetical protein
MLVGRSGEVETNREGKEEITTEGTESTEKKRNANKR